MSNRTSTSTTTYTQTGSAVTYVNNELFTGFISIANAAGVSTSWLHSRREKLTHSLQTWLEEESLSKVRLEIVDGRGTVKEAYVFDVSYEGDRGYVNFPVDSVTRRVTTYGRDDYQVEVTPVTYTWSSDLDGWSSGGTTTYRSRHLDDFGAEHIDVDVEKVTDTSNL